MWLIVILSILLRTALGQENCGIQVPANDGKFQIYLKGFRWQTPLDTYNGSKDVVFHGDTITFTCENGFVNDYLWAETYTFQCTNGKFNKSLLYEDLLCKSDFHKDTVVYQIPNIEFGSALMKCEGKHLEAYKVYSRKDDGRLRHLYTVCFDKNVMRTKFVFQPRRLNSPSPRRESRRDVWGFDFFGRNAKDKLRLSDGYVSRIQKRRITNAFPNKYNKNNKYPYSFNRGHLAPYSDFIDPEDRRASCEYINAAPQWKEFNGNSWSLVERQTRQLIENDTIDWEIYTGTYGHIPTTRGPLFVSPFFDENGRFCKGFVPVPKLYWKVVYNLRNVSESRVFVGVNNPELKSPEDFGDKYKVCKPKPNNQGALFQGSEFKGFTYECCLEDFLNRLAKDEGVVKF